MRIPNLDLLDCFGYSSISCLFLCGLVCSWLLLLSSLACCCFFLCCLLFLSSLACCLLLLSSLARCSLFLSSLARCCFFLYCSLSSLARCRFFLYCTVFLSSLARCSLFLTSLARCRFFLCCSPLLSSLAGDVRLMRPAVVSSSRRWEQQGVLTNTVLNQLVLLGREVGVPVAKMARWYYGGRGRKAY